MNKEIENLFKFHLLAVFSVSLVCIVIYSNTLNSPFLFDDIPNIEENAFVRLTKLDFKQFYNAGFNGPSKYRPIANISFALNYYFGEYEVRGYHIVNIIIHVINGVLVYFLSLIILRQTSHIAYRGKKEFHISAIPLMSLFVALVFVVHPLQTQSVTYIVQRMNSMSVMFFFLALLLYMKGRVTPIKWKRLLLFSGCFISWVMALGSKQIAATLPLIVLLYEWLFFQDLQLGWLRANWKYFILILVVAGLMAFIYLGGSPVDKILKTYEQRDFTILERVLTQFRVLVFYISLLIFPHPSRLNLLHDISISHSLLEPITTLFSLGFIAGLIGLAIYMAKRERLVSFCILWFFVNLVLESSLIGLEIIYEHRLYLPMFSFALLLSYLLFHSLLNRRLLATGLSIFIILSLGTATYLRNGVWKDDLIFWSDVVSKKSQNHRAHVALGNVLKDMGKKGEAVGHYEEALRIKPDYVKGHNNLGIVLEEQGRIEEAIEHYYEALRINPGIAETHYNMGNSLASQRKYKEAIIHYEEAVRIKPDYAKAHNGLGSALNAQGRIKEASSHYEEALRIRPDYASAYNNLGVVLLRQRKLREAIDSYAEALRIRPNYAEAHYNMGNALASQKKLKEAIIHYEEAIRIKPDYAKAHNNLGAILLRQGKPKEAEGFFSKAIMINPGIAEVHNNLGVALLRQGKFNQAIEPFTEAVRIRPNYEEAQKNLETALRNTWKSRED